MSYCEIISFKDGKPNESMECRNAWGGAAYIWSQLFDRYIKDPKIPYHNWLSDCGKDGSELWGLARRADLPEFMRAVHASTFDRAVVFRKDFIRFTDHLREFVSHFGTGPGVCHLLAWAQFIEDHMDAEAVGFYGTSVAENQWYDWDEEREVSTPYDLNTRDDHWDVYDELIVPESVPLDTTGMGEPC